MRMDQLNNIDNKEVDLLSNEGSVFPNTQVRSIMPKNKNGNKQKRLAKKITRDSSPANPTVESEVTEAGGYYTQPVYDMIEKHGYEKVMHELLTSLDADVIQSFLQRNEINEAGDTKYGIVRYPDTAISYIKNDGNGWEHIYDRSYGFKGPVDKNDMQYASKIEKEKIPSRMFKEGGLSHSDIPSRYAVEADERSPEYYRDLDKGQLNHTKSMLMKTAGQLNVAIEQRYKFSKEMMGTGDRVGTGDLQNMLDTLNQLIDGWEESTKIYGK